jgi:hypothetical protein
MTINDMVRNYRHYLDNSLRMRLCSVRIHIEGYLDDETNVEIVINIPDALYEPIIYRSGNSGNQLTIDIDHYGVDYTWTRRTFTKRGTDFFSGVVKNVGGFLASVWGGFKSIGSSFQNAIEWN